MKLNLIINHTSMEPIYEQIMIQIKAGIIEGTLTAGGHFLPCVHFQRTKDQCTHGEKKLMIVWKKRDWS